MADDYISLYTGKEIDAAVGYFLSDEAHKNIELAREATEKAEAAAAKAEELSAEVERLATELADDVKYGSMLPSVYDPQHRETDIFKYVDEHSGGSGDGLPITGGTMQGDIQMDANRISGLPTPSEGSDAASKEYVDGVVGEASEATAASLDRLILIFSNVTVPISAWSEDAEEIFEGFPYVADIALDGMTPSHVPDVIFSIEDAESGLYSALCESRAGSVRIWASAVPEGDLVVRTITAIKEVGA